ncbi:MAG TPA: hypothetical protein VKB92_10250 [Myxococcales bacterium]|nr:hypothetical protein [Myxococcales bacterium]
MRKRIELLLASVVLQAGAARALTAEELVARNLEARGGAAKIAAIRSLRSTGTASFSFGDAKIDAQYAQLQKRPGMVRTEVSLQGLTAVDAYDGRDGWEVQPFFGRRDPHRTSVDEAKELQRLAEIGGPLAAAATSGHRVEYLGTDDLDGTPAHKLRVTRKDGDVQYVFRDPDYFLEIRVVTESKVRGVDRITETDLGGYEQVAGVWFPFSIESGEKGRPRSFRLTIERAEPDVQVDDALFRFPTGPVGRAVLAGPPQAQKTVSAAPPAPAARKAEALDSGVISGVGSRNIGSAAMSGRIAALAARNQDGKTTLYVGAASGGVWKSADGGTTFRPVFDKAPVQSIGAIVIDPTNPQTVWVGTGESWTRNSVSVGDGIYKSTDGGETWTNMGLRNSERIDRILVHPKNGNVVYACVPGKLWSDSSDRGLYKTTDGGRTWDLVLTGQNYSTGCAGLSMDPKDPNVLFAGLWDFRRKGWTFRSGGEGPDAPSGSGLYRSADGGASWTELSKGGLPPKPWGRVEVAVAPSNGSVVYAFVESKDSALYRSADGGKTWEARDKSQLMVWRPFYFARLVVDPTNADRVFKPDLNLIVSDDGGRSFAQSGGRSHGDWHDVWVDPDNPKHVVGGDDGGLWISYDGGSRWWKAANLPVSQFYHVSVDDKDPYQVYGGLQDNSSWVGDSAYPGGISNSRWENVYNGDGFWTWQDPSDPDAVYAEFQGGYIGRVDRRTLATRDIQPKAGYKEKLRFNWNTPIAVSPTQKGTLYIGAQFLFRSRDKGDSWERISPDLTSNDPQQQKQEQSGGVTVDNSAAEMHTTIYSISESRFDPNVIWVGTDDGNVQLTRNGGKSWANLTRNVQGLPPSSWVSWIEASRHQAGTAYAAFDRHTFGDMTPWVYRTGDYGKTWTRIVTPQQGVRGHAHVIKEDPVRPQLLFVGTEMGLWISLDGGKQWAEFKGGGFPAVAVRDLAFQQRDADLAIATHGRGIWVIDDLTPLRALTPDLLARDAAFLPGRQPQQRMPAQGGGPEGDASFTGENPASGAVITWYQRTRHLFGPIRLEVLDAQGKPVDTIPATKRRGLNRVSWTMRMPAPRVPRAAQLAFNASQGPRVPPGTYTIRLTKGAQVLETKLEVVVDRRAPYGVAERRANFEAGMRVHALFGDMSALVDRIDGARAAIEARTGALPQGDELGARLRGVSGRLEEVKKKVVATKEGGAITGEERIREHADLLYGAFIQWEGSPAKYQLDRIDVLRRELSEVRAEFDRLASTEVRALDDALRQRNLAPIPATQASLDLPADGATAVLRCDTLRLIDCVPVQSAGAVAAERD